MSEQQTWVVMPVLAGPAMTEAAIADVLAQSAQVRLLVINQGVDDAFRDHLERLAEQESDRLLLWSHMPPLPSLAATWNRALDFVWACGGAEALVVNNDVRLHRRTVEVLRLYQRDELALFVSAVGVTAEQFNPNEPSGIPSLPDGSRLTMKGGPDFSCFLISRACHERFRFDESYVPAFCEDLDTHRRMMLAGEGSRIFSVNLPYLHLASQTLKALDPKEADRIRSQIDAVSRAHYARKWGGPVNAEQFWVPFNDPAQAGYALNEAQVLAVGEPPTTPKLFDYERTRWLAPVLSDFRDMSNLLKETPDGQDAGRATSVGRTTEADADIPF